MKWQPIKTAPKDGTWVVLYCSSNDTFYFDVEYRNGAWYEWDGYIGSWTKIPVWIKPTHWMIVTRPNGDNE